MHHFNDTSAFYASSNVMNRYWWIAQVQQWPIAALIRTHVCWWYWFSHTSWLYDHTGCSYGIPDCLASNQRLRQTYPGVGVTKAPFVNFSASKIFDLAEVPVRFFVSHSYLPGVTAAQLRRHLANINVIVNGYCMFWQCCKTRNITEIGLLTPTPVLCKGCHWQSVKQKLDYAYFYKPFGWINKATTPTHVVFPDQGLFTILYARQFLFNVINIEKAVRNGIVDWHQTKGMHVDRMLDPLCNLCIRPHAWPRIWILFLK